MKKIMIITVGKIKKGFIRDGIDFYKEMLKPFCRLEICQIKEEGYGSLSDEKIREIEAEKIISKLEPEAVVIGLERIGREMNSNQLAGLFEKEMISGHSKVIFIIGGIHGLSQRIIDRCKHVLSFSKLTFPHQLFRLILLEQLYRVNKIIRGEPYHY